MLLVVLLSLNTECGPCRVEDTDQARSTKESEAAVLRDLAWLGITYDEGQAPLLSSLPGNNALGTLITIRSCNYRKPCMP